MEIQIGQREIDFLKSMENFPLLHVDLSKNTNSLIANLYKYGYIEKTESTFKNQNIQEYKISIKGKELLEGKSWTFKKTKMQSIFSNLWRFSPCFIWIWQKNLTIYIESDYDSHVKVALKLGNEQIYYDEVSVKK